MLKNKICLGIILSIILLVFSMNGFTAYYKYTQESGTNFYVGIADKADALEDTNEIRQIIDDLGALLEHSKRDDSYPKDGTSGGAIQIPETGLKFNNDPVNDDIAAYIAGEMTWQTKAELGIDLSFYYLKTEIDSQGEIETIWGVTLATDSELAALKFTDLTDTPANYTGEAGKYVKVNAGETALEFGTPGGGGDMTKAVYDIDTDNIVDKAETVDDGAGNSSTAVDVKDAVTKKHSQNTDTDLDATFEATFVKKADTVNVLSDITSPGANIEDAVTKMHSQNTDTTLVLTNALGSDHTYSGEVDSQPVGESVVFGDLLYFDWTDKEWKKTDADAAATMPGFRIALESKTDGQTCLMLVKGYIRDDSAFEFTAAMVYTSATAGAMTSTAPSTAGQQLQRVGVAKSADILFFDPSIDVGEIKEI